MHEHAQARWSTKRHPVVLIRNVLALQFAAAGVYSLAASLVHFAQLWRSFSWLSFVPFPIAQAFFVFFVETVLLVVIFMSWYREQLYVFDGAVVRASGLFRRSKHSLVVPGDALVRHTQNLMGRLANYGTVFIRVPPAGGTDSGVETRIRHVPEAERFVAAVRGAAGSIASAHPDQLLDEPEHDGLEFKSTLRWDVRAGKVNRSLERAAIKTVAAFLNTKGGHLVLGVRDDRTVCGLDEDIATLQNKSRDGLELHIGNLFNGMIGGHLRGCLAVRWSERSGKPFCVISVSPSAEPAFVRTDNDETFYVRTGNGTTALRVSQVSAYLKQRFPEHD